MIKRVSMTYHRSGSPSDTTTSSNTTISTAAAAAAAADDDEFICDACKIPGDVVCCLTCPRSYHLHCAGLPKVPKGGYQCSICDPKKQDNDWNKNIIEMRERLPVNRRFDVHLYGNETEFDSDSSSFTDNDFYNN